MEELKLYENAEVLRDYAEKTETINAEQKISLVHGDLHIRNLLVDEHHLLIGVIDWGDAHIGHPAVDLSVIYNFLLA